eukprot:2421409-Prymnesium_polylepis.1
MESPKKAGVAELKLPTVSELATSVAEANAALSYQLKRIANLEAELRTSNAERDAATGARSQEFLLMQTSISDLEMQVRDQKPAVVRSAARPLWVPSCVFRHGLTAPLGVWATRAAGPAR